MYHDVFLIVYRPVGRWCPRTLSENASFFGAFIGFIVKKALHPPGHYSHYKPQQ